MKDGKLETEECKYFLEKQKEAIGNLFNKDYDKVVTGLKEPLEKLEGVLKESNTKLLCPQNSFEAGIFLNYLGQSVTQKDFSPVNLYDICLLNAAANYNLQKYDEAKKYYQKALERNPASGIARVQIMDINIRNNDYSNILNDAKDLLYFSYTRIEIAKAYKFVGDYLRHEKDYEMAIVAYFLSTAYDLNDEIANLATETAVEANISLDDAEWLSEEYMKKFYDKYSVPLMPNEKLVSLAKAMGEDAYNKKAYKVSRLSYGIAFNLTLDEKYKKLADEINSKFENNN